MDMAAKAQALGIRFLDAPVTGSKEPAALGKLIFGWAASLPMWKLAARFSNAWAAGLFTAADKERGLFSKWS